MVGVDWNGMKKLCSTAALASSTDLSSPFIFNAVAHKTKHLKTQIQNRSSLSCFSILIIAYVTLIDSSNAAFTDSSITTSIDPSIVASVNPSIVAWILLFQRLLHLSTLAPIDASAMRDERTKKRYFFFRLDERTRKRERETKNGFCIWGLSEGI